jgi:signal transduction histidine kinase
MKLKFLLEERAVIKIENGYFDSENLEYHFKLNGVDKRLSIHDHTINGLKPFRDRFGNSGSVLRTRKIECGSFSFGFYIFDFSSGASGKYKLDSSDKSILKDHRIYLYRDNIRVYPYGEPEDDWLQIDIYRGTIAAGHFLSNDQVVGYVNITQEHNPKLQDKTNREGLISEGNATEDFITVLQSLLFYLRHKPYHQYLINKKKRETQDISKKQQVEDSFKKLESAIGDNSKAKKILLDTIKDYKKEKSFLTQRAETTEDLAGIGISVETASHDIMGIMSKILANLDALISDLLSTGVINEDELLKDLQSIRGGLSFIAAQLKDIQLLFRSSKQRRKLVRVRDILDKVLRIYKFIFSKESIETVVNTTGSPLTVKTTDAVLLQLFLNLFDNAVFWLLQTENNNKKIEITLNGNNGKMIFADNGPGINEEDLPYIFEPFYSGKGEEGRGLGLYIARQLLERHDFSIEVITVESEKILHGANFVINFYNEE